MDKLVKLVSLDFLKGDRTSILLLGYAVLVSLSALGIIADGLLSLLVKIGLPFVIYFAWEHFKGKA